ncbi:nucleotidyltransferase domain-containing protein [Ahniella affigens]|nr:nucleotidyltransferase domain-containing protein [Ahniella affigens]
MIDPIRNALAELETRNGIKVLFAAESGSRAWGFASPDSDYDVRFIYAPPLAWFLNVEEPRDVIEAMLPGDLDLSGWALSKALRLYHKNNCALFEWLDSPVIYHEHGTLAQRLRTLLPRIFRQPAAYHHYWRTAVNVYETALSTDPVKLKRMFYVLRPLLCCRYILAHRRQPPTAFASLVEACLHDPIDRQALADLQAEKVQVGEGHLVTLSAFWRDWLRREFAAAEAVVGELKSDADVPLAELNGVLREVLIELWPAELPALLRIQDE